MAKERSVFQIIHAARPPSHLLSCCQGRPEDIGRLWRVAECPLLPGRLDSAIPSSEDEDATRDGPVPFQVMLLDTPLLDQSGVLAPDAPKRVKQCKHGGLPHLALSNCLKETLVLVEPNGGSHGIGRCDVLGIVPRCELAPRHALKVLDLARKRLGGGSGGGEVESAVP